MSKTPGEATAYQALFSDLLPEEDIRIWPDSIGDPADIEYAVVGVPEPGVLADLPNLQAVLSLWAGIDSLLTDETFPRDVPLARMVDPLLAADMSHFAIYWTLHFHRGLHRYADLQREGTWKQIPYPEAKDRRVGVMGLGTLGEDAARKISALGFDVAGWNSSERHIEGVETFIGEDRLWPFLARTDILIVLLPLTGRTRGIINAETLLALPDGAFLVSLARGAHIVEKDLLAALNSGRLGGAALDVFTAEPLPEGHPFWSHPRIAVTPHVASTTTPRTAAAEVAIDIRRLRAGRMPRHLVDMSRGY